MFTRASNVVFANTLSFHVRENNWNGVQFFFSTFIIWPKVSGNMQITKLPKKFLVSQYFQSSQNVWAKMKNFFNLYEVLKIIVQKKNLKMPIFFKC
jgi:hypothetical protein